MPSKGSGPAPRTRTVEPLTPSRNGSPHSKPRSLRESRQALRSRLEARRAEIEQAALTRLYAISDPKEVSDPAYVEGLRNALSVALDYGLTVIERGEEHAPPVPTSLLAQARMAARNGVGLDTVLRRYVAGYSLLSEFVIEEAEEGGFLGDVTLQSILRGQAAVLDRLIAAVSEEHGRESNGRPTSAEQRRAERIERLLAGELLDTSEFAYDFDAHHLAAIAKGPGATEALHELASSLDTRPLIVRREEGTHWAWFGSRRGIQVERLPRSTLPPQLSLALGEPGEDLPGWRLSHRQARAALPIALRSPGLITRYAEVALLASIFQDDLLATSLRKLYLEPLEAERDGGSAAKETLRAYFAAGRNAASAAAVLGVSRQAVNSRLHTIESRLPRQLEDCAAELEAALRVERLDPPGPTVAIPPGD